MLLVFLPWWLPISFVYDVIIQVVSDLPDVAFNQEVHVSKDVDQSSDLTWPSHQNQSYNYFLNVHKINIGKIYG